MNPQTGDRVVVFDLDGTLFSSEAILGDAYREAVAATSARWGVPLRTPTLVEILSLVGRPVREIFHALYPDLSAAQREELAGAVLVILDRKIRAGEGRLYDGVPAMLAALRDAGCRIALVSNCRRAYLEAIFDTYTLWPYFVSERCNEDEPELGKTGLVAEAVAGARGIMVGDRASDGEAARAAGIPWIGCDYGHADDGSGLNELSGADVVVRSVDEIPRVVRKLREASR